MPGNRSCLRNGILRFAHSFPPDAAAPSAAELAPGPAMFMVCAMQEAQCDWEAKKDKALLTTIAKLEKNE